MKTAELVNQINKFGAVAFVPKGNSMYPFIKNKVQSVYITKKEDRLSQYDIGLYLRGKDSYVLHRVVEVKEDGYVFCGDSQYFLEEVKEDKVIGVYTACQRRNKIVEFSEKDRKKAQRWYKFKVWRRIRLFVFFFCVKVKRKLKKIFQKKDK